MPQLSDFSRSTRTFGFLYFFAGAVMNIFGRCNGIYISTRDGGEPEGFAFH